MSVLCRGRKRSKGIGKGGYMIPSINEEWDKLKKDIETNLKNLIEDDNKKKEDVETYKVMLSMLKTIKETK